MGLVSICKYPRAVTPYQVEAVGVSLYSMEELAWFLYRNIFLIDVHFFDEKLCDWLIREVKNPELAHRIRNGVSAGINFQNLVLSVVGAVDLFDNEEIMALGERLKAMNGLKEQERLKLRADELLENHNDWAAIDAYQRILKMHQNNRLGMKFYGDVWYNLGVAYTRQFLFENAAECFEISDEYAPDEGNERAALLSRDLAENKIPEREKKQRDYSQPQKKLLEWQQEYRGSAV